MTTTSNFDPEDFDRLVKRNTWILRGLTVLIFSMVLLQIYLVGKF